MFLVRCDQTGDSGECERDAVVTTGLRLIDDAIENGMQSRLLTVSIYEDEQLVRTRVKKAQLGSVSL